MGVVTSVAISSVEDERIAADSVVAVVISVAVLISSEDDGSTLTTISSCSGNSSPACSLALMVTVSSESTRDFQEVKVDGGIDGNAVVGTERYNHNGCW